MTRARHPHAELGFSLIELMVAITISLIVMIAIVGMFASGSGQYQELQKAGQQIENGRYAMEILNQDLRNAGYYGDYSAPTIPSAATLPDPCTIPTAATAAAFWNAAWPFPVQAYDAPTGSPLSCIDNANFVPGTDILVVRRADSNSLPRPSATPAGNDVYLQALPSQAEIQLGGGTPVNTNSQKADGTAATMLRKDGTAADLRKFHVHIYFVSPCNRPADGGTVCTGTGDDGGRPAPTLKRLELTTNGSGATVLRTVPLVQGIENLQIDFGLDENPADASTVTSLIGDGSPDRYVTSPTAASLPATNPATVSNWQNVVTASIYILARNTEMTAGYSDPKTYSLGLGGTVSPGGNVRRHLFNSVVRINNVSVKREIPQ